MRNFKSNAEADIERESNYNFNTSWVYEEDLDIDTQEITFVLGNNRNGTASMNVVHVFVIPALEYANERITERIIREVYFDIYEEIRTRSKSKELVTKAFLIPDGYKPEPKPLIEQLEKVKEKAIESSSRSYVKPLVFAASFAFTTTTLLLYLLDVI